METDHQIIDANFELNKIDPSTFATNGGPSIAEEMAREGVWWKRADNRRVQGQGPIGGWNQVRGRLIGEDDCPMIFFMDCCTHLIRTLPLIPTDPTNLDDIDSDSEDHAADALRYGCMARPYNPPKNYQHKDSGEKLARAMHTFTMDEAWQCGTQINTSVIHRG